MRRVYVWLVVLSAWVFFRAETLPDALSFMSAMLGASSVAGAAYPPALYLDGEVVLVLALGLLGATPWIAQVEGWYAGHREARGAAWPPALELGFEWGRFAFLNAVLLCCAVSLAAGTHNPFIYFRF